LSAFLAAGGVVPEPNEEASRKSVLLQAKIWGTAAETLRAYVQSVLSKCSQERASEILAAMADLGQVTRTDRGVPIPGVAGPILVSEAEIDAEVARLEADLARIRQAKQVHQQDNNAR